VSEASPLARPEIASDAISKGVPVKRLLLTRGSVLALVSVCLLAQAFPASASGGPLLETTVAVPRENRIPLDLSYEKSALTSVESQNEPTEKDLREAEKSDPNDKKFVVFRFYYKNEDYVDHQVKLRAVLLDGNDAVIGEGGRTGTLDKGKTEDTISFPMRMKTLDWPRAAKLKVIASFLK
jgi:hypothetical protein